MYKRQDYTQEGIYHFRKIFYEQFAQYPDYYACTGYEMMLFLGHMLDKYGIYFQKYWNRQPYRGIIFGDTVYGAHHDNQQVAVIKFQGNKFVCCHTSAPDD